MSMKGVRYYGKVDFVRKLTSQIVNEFGPPIMVKMTGSDGRGVFSTRRISAGDLIHTANPILTHPSLSMSNNVCCFCLKRIQSAPYSTYPRFCTQHCAQQSTALFYDIEMKADWSAFNDYCRTEGLKYPLLVKRLACMVLSGSTTANTLDILQPDTLTPPAISQMEVEFNMLRNVFKRANFSDGEITFLTCDWYTSVLARVRINAFRIEFPLGGLYEDILLAASVCVEGESAVGNAVYMLPSMYNHDCDPNAHIVWIDSANGLIKSLRDIEAGEELRICYIEASMDRDARQAVLSQGFGFKCKCFRCMSGD